jgi:hypothetical protein
MVIVIVDTDGNILSRWCPQVHLPPVVVPTGQVFVILPESDPLAEMDFDELRTGYRYDVQNQVFFQIS